jgi:hypothetical protein
MKVTVVLTGRNSSGYMLCPFPKYAAVVIAVCTRTAHHSNNAHTLFFSVCFVEYIVCCRDKLLTTQCCNLKNPFS